MVKKRKAKSKSPPSQLLDAAARRSDVSGPATPASDQQENSFDHTPVKTSPELARQVETLDALLASQRTELEESTPFNNASFESNDDLEDELNQLAMSEAQLRRELELLQGGAFFSDDEEEQRRGKLASKYIPRQVVRRTDRCSKKPDKVSVSMMMKELAVREPKKVAVSSDEDFEEGNERLGGFEQAYNLVG
jgi:cell division protein FtsB